MIDMMLAGGEGNNGLHEFRWLPQLSKRPFWSLGFESQGAARRALRGALIAALMMAVTAGLRLSLAQQRDVIAWSV